MELRRPLSSCNKSPPHCHEEETVLRSLQVSFGFYASSAKKYDGEGRES